MRRLIAIALWLVPLAAMAQDDGNMSVGNPLGSLEERPGPFSGPGLPRVWSPKPRPQAPVIVGPPAASPGNTVVVVAPPPPPVASDIEPSGGFEPGYIVPAPLFRPHRHHHGIIRGTPAFGRRGHFQRGR
jgi:hypothetical protein